MHEEYYNENNSKIAKFIGWEQGMLSEWTNPLEKPKEGWVNIYNPFDLHFHDNWNWLMDYVIPYIESLDSDPHLKHAYTIEITSSNVSIFRNIFNAGESRIISQIAIVDDNKKQAVYEVALRFIDWYIEKEVEN